MSLGTAMLFFPTVSRQKNDFVVREREREREKEREREREREMM